MNGKIRARLQIPTNADQAATSAAAIADETVQKFLEGKPVRKTIYVPNRLLNLIV